MEEINKQEFLNKVGDIKRGNAIGRKRNCNYIWQLCSICGKGRWVKLIYNKPESDKCKACNCRDMQRRMRFSHKYSGENSPHWKGGRTKRTDGYIEIWFSPDDFFHPMTYRSSRRNYVPEHRLVMAKYLNRCLLPWEVVHHKNGIKDDNCVENLQLISTWSNHLPDMLSKSYIRRLEKRVSELIKENKDLKGIVSQYCPHCRYNKNPCDYPYIVDKISPIIKEVNN